jgi:hypothetical protein
LGRIVWIYWRDEGNNLKVEIGWNSFKNENVFQYLFGYDFEVLYHKVLWWMPVQKPEPPESEDE